MVGPKNLDPVELARFGLAIIERRAPIGEKVRRVYCVRCGSQVAAEHWDVDPEGWWACPRRCNTLYAVEASMPPARPST